MVNTDDYFLSKKIHVPPMKRTGKNLVKLSERLEAFIFILSTLYQVNQAFPQDSDYSGR